jgi:hypothetical protein
MEINLFLGVLKEGLKLWNDRQATKYLDRIIALEKEYHEELNKPDEEQSDYKLDSIMLELTLISQSFLHYPAKRGNPNSNPTT